MYEAIGSNKNERVSIDERTKLARLLREKTVSQEGEKLASVGSGTLSGTA